MDFKKIHVVDIETPPQSFLLSAYSVERKEFVDFLINDKVNDLYKLIKWLKEVKDIPMVGWNILNFDIQLIEYIWRNYQDWHDYTGLEIAQLLAQKATETIENSQYGIFSTYRESDLSFKVIDLFKIHHGDNKNRMSSMSLKCMEYYLDEEVEVFDWSNSAEVFEDKEVDQLVSYCHLDCYTTYKMYLLTLGETENPVYKDNNQIQIRLDIQEEFGIPCMNYSYAKIGDEIVKLFYCNEKNIKYSQLPKSGTFRKTISLKRSVPEYVEFKSQVLQDLLLEIKSTAIKQDEEFARTITYGGETYVLARGGLHSESENKFYHSDDEYVIMDADVSGYYVVTAIERGYFPQHLGKEFLSGYKQIYDKRIQLKPQSKANKRIAGIVKGLKEGGVSVYGKSADMDSWLFDKQFASNICISGELSLLMLIEAQELLGNRCIMGNTDGATFIVKRSEIDKFNEACKDWCKMTNYELEYTEFKSLWFSNVNNYIGLKKDGSIKKVGASFNTEHEIHENKSNKVVPLALEAYFTKGTPVEVFINSHNNIFDFCARGKVNRNFYLKSVDRKAGKETKYNKLIRYYVSKTGEKLYKVKRDECQTNAVKMSEVAADERYQTLLNKPDPALFQTHLENVKREWYIQKAKDIIFKIERGRKPKKVKTNPDQISLF